MPIEDSRNKGGVLILDAQPFEKQMTSVELVPSEEEDGDRLEVLSGEVIEPDEITSWELQLGAIQDFVDPAGFVEFARTNKGELVSFVWAPNGAGQPAYSGTVRVRAVTIGGEVASRLTTTKAWPVIGDPDRHEDYDPVEPEVPEEV